MERINIDTLPETNVDWYADGERVNADVLNRPIKQVAGIVNALIDAVNDQSGTDTGEWSETLSTKAPINNPTFTGTVSGVTKAMVGLGDVDNTSDLDKPISTATQAALDGKAAAIHTHDASDITSGTLSDERLPAIQISKVTDLQSTLNAKQDALVSGTNIKTINGESILGGGDLIVDGFRTYRTVSTSLPSGVPRQGEEWIMVE